MTKNEQRFIDFAQHHWAQCGNHTQMRLAGKRVVQIRCAACHTMIEATVKNARKSATLVLAVIEDYVGQDATMQ